MKSIDADEWIREQIKRGRTMEVPWRELVQCTGCGKRWKGLEGNDGLLKHQKICRGFEE